MPAVRACLTSRYLQAQITIDKLARQVLAASSDRTSFELYSPSLDLAIRSTAGATVVAYSADLNIRQYKSFSVCKTLLRLSYAIQSCCMTPFMLGICEGHAWLYCGPLLHVMFQDPVVTQEQEKSEQGRTP